MIPEFPLYGIYKVDTPIKTITQQIFKNQKNHNTPYHYYYAKKNIKSWCYLHTIISFMETIKLTSICLKFVLNIFTLTNNFNHTIQN